MCDLALVIPAMATRSPFRWSLEYVWHNFWALFFGTTHYPRLILCFPCLSPESAFSPRNSGKCYLKPTNWALNCACSYHRVIVPTPCQHTNWEHISVSGSMFLSKKSWVHTAVFSSCSKIGFILAFSLSSCFFLW